MDPTRIDSEIKDRRPIAARSSRYVHGLAMALARARISPNTISILGMLAACAAGGFLAGTPHANEAGARAMFVLAAVFVALRLLANVIDGLVAVEGNMKSPLGVLYNEVPDRVSDSVVLIGAGYAADSGVIEGYAAATLAMFVTYLRALGRSLGLKSDYRGPMAKQQRMALVIAACLLIACLPREWWTVDHVGVMRAALWLVCAGCVVTAWRRLAGVATGLTQAAGTTLLDTGAGGNEGSSGVSSRSNG